jgi:hypothetical protein
MTMSEVPTSTPAPSRVRVRSWRGEREKESGTMPAMKELRLSGMHSKAMQHAIE